MVSLWERRTESEIFFHWPGVKKDDPISAAETVAGERNCEIPSAKIQTPSSKTGGEGFSVGGVQNRGGEKLKVES